MGYITAVRPTGLTNWSQVEWHNREFSRCLLPGNRSWPGVHRNRHPHLSRRPIADDSRHRSRARDRHWRADWPSSLQSFTGQGYNPSVNDLNFTGLIEKLHLRDEGGRVHIETVPTLPQMVQSIHDSGANVVLQLDLKDKEAVEPAYWQLKNLTNRAGVPANRWCIYKLQATWWKTPKEFEALPWVRDAFREDVRLAYIPVHKPQDEGDWDVFGGLKAFARTNYTISAETEMRAKGGLLQGLLDLV